MVGNAAHASGESGEPAAPPLAAALAACLAALAGMTAVRLWVYPDVAVPLSYSLPLLLTLWHRNPYLNWGLAVGLASLASAKMIFVLPGELPATDRFVFLGMQLTTIGVTAGALHAIVAYRRALRVSNAQLASSNAELEASNEELAAREEEILRQNDELQNQAEELEQQMQEVEHQAEELQTQGQELRHLNEELAEREQTLDNLLRLAQAARNEAQLLNEICLTAPRLLGEPAVAAALLESLGDRLVPRATCGLAEDEDMSLDLSQTLARHVLERDQVAHVADLTHRPDIHVPPSPDGGAFRSVLSAPVHLDGKPVGVLEVYSPSATEWSQRQVDLIRWLTGQCALAWSAVRFRQALGSANDTLEATVAQRTAELQRRTSDLQRLASQLNLVEQRERRRIAQVLHDDLQQLLVAARMRLDVALSEGAGWAKQADDLIGRAITVSRTLTAELSPPVLLEARFDAAVRWWARRMEEQHGLRVEVEVGPDAEPPSDEWRVFLFSAIGECLFNVVKHAGTDTASIDVRRIDGYLRVTIADRGRGIGRPEDKATDGTFGLFNIRERAALMGGATRIDSASGVGTKVELFAPMDGPAAAGDPAQIGNRTADEAALAVPGIPRSAVVRVIVADDHQMVRDGIVGRLAARSDLQVVGQAADGVEAIGLIETLQPDVVVMDISMPKMDGVRATREIRERWPRVSVVGMSMHEEDEMVAAMREAGAAAYVVKGAPLEDLVGAILRVAAEDATASPASAD